MAWGGFLQAWPWVHNFTRPYYSWHEPTKDTPLFHYIQHMCNVTICGTFMIAITPSLSICGTLCPH
jgi:hypothetical protein